MSTGFMLNRFVVLSDSDGGLINFYRVLTDDARFKRLLRLVELTPYSRKEYEECKRLLAHERDPVMRAWRWYVVARMSVSGRFGRGWAYSIRTSTGNSMSLLVSAYLSSVSAFTTCL